MNKVPFAVSACGIVQCETDDNTKCGSYKPSTAKFNSMKITATFDADKRRDLLILPSTLDTSLYPLSGWTYNEHNHDKHFHAYVTSNEPTGNLATFGIWSKDFSQDVQ